MSSHHTEWEYDEDVAVFDSEEEVDDDPTSDYVPSEDDEPQSPRRRLVQPRDPVTVSPIQDETSASTGSEDDEDEEDSTPDVDVDVSSTEPDILEGDIPDPENLRGSSLDIPESFPNMILHVLMLMNRPERITAREFLWNIKIIADVITDNFSLTVQRDIAAFLALAPQQVQSDIAYMIAEMMDYLWVRNGNRFVLSSVLEYMDEYHSHALYAWLFDLPDEVIAAVMSRPVTQHQLLHLTSHVRIFARSDGRTAIEVTECVEKLYTPPRSTAEVTAFIKSLTIVNPNCLDDDEVCGICRGSYAETYLEAADDEGEPRALPCGHVFNKNCLRLLLDPKPHGWQYLHCPLCRTYIQFPGDQEYNILP